MNWTERMGSALPTIVTVLGLALRLPEAQDRTHTWKQGTLTLPFKLIAVLCLLAFTVFPPVSRAQAPVFVITPEGSSIKFHVKASVALDGTFDKWRATLTFTSSDAATG